jgi:hypothetical protein
MYYEATYRVVYIAMSTKGQTYLKDCLSASVGHCTRNLQQWNMCAILWL